MTELSPRQLAAKRAWETIRANRAAGRPPAYKSKARSSTAAAPNPEGLTPRQVAARKAWDTMRANGRAPAVLQPNLSSRDDNSAAAPAARVDLIALASTMSDAPAAPVRKPKPIKPPTYVSRPVGDTPELAAARAALAAKAKGPQPVAEKSPHAGRPLVTLGNGRVWVVISIGPKFATLFNAPTMETRKLPRLDFDRVAQPRPDHEVHSAKRIIEERTRDYDRMQREYSKANARAAWEVVEAASRAVPAPESIEV